ncbi:MAG TPA: carboxypeptidase-like regulatory domain-containing protein [Candidatus Thermoplasmatota archaeon]
MVKRLTLSVASLLLVSMSACVDDGGPTSTDDSDPASIEEGTGGIEGTVVDASLAPLEGAQVGILSLNLVAVTGAHGTFRLDGIEPGRYDVAVQKLGFSSTISSVEVVEGQRVLKTFTLDALPTLDPYHIVLVERGSFGCGIAYRPQQAGIVGASVCGAVTAYAGENQFDKFLIIWDLVGPYTGWQGAAYEMEWTTTQALGSGLWVRFETDLCSGSLESTFTSLRGRSPLREVQNAALVAEKLASNEEGPCGTADRCSEGACLIQSRVFPHTEALGDSYPADIGVTIQQPFTQYFTQFFQGEPPSDYSALADS